MREDISIFKNAVKEYNDILYSLGLEYLTIGTRFSEGTEKWNLRDMVSEIQYQYSTYGECGHANYEQLHSSDAYDRLQAMRECKKLKNFIEKYKHYVSNIRCHQGHCSKFDN